MIKKLLKNLSLNDLSQVYFTVFNFNHDLNNFFFYVPEKYTRKYITDNLAAFSCVSEIKEIMENLGIK